MIGDKIKYDLFCANTTRKNSMELDFGVWWRDRDMYPSYRVSWIEDTGELYAVDQGEVEAEILGEIIGREAVEKKLKGWAEECGKIKSLDWIRKKFL